MHREIEDHLEQVLAEPDHAGPAAVHLAQCEPCRSEVSAMRRQAALWQVFRAPETSPRAGFYARVMERIEAQRPISIWQLFFDSVFGRRIAVASMAVAFLFSIYLISSERLAEPPTTIAVEELQPGMTLSAAGLPDKDTVLVNLVTYRGQ